MNEFISSLVNYNFLSRALITSIIVGIVCGVVGSLIILRGLSLMGDAMSHAVLPGVALSFLFNIPMFIGALTTGMITSFLIGYISQHSKTKNDAAIGIIYTAFLSIGIILISQINSATDLYHILFGNILAITTNAFYTTSIVSIIVILSVIIFYKPLHLSTFDPIAAKMSGLNIKLIHYFIMMLLALVTVASLQTVGIILVVALLITPSSTAYLITNSLKSMMITASILSAISAAIGMYVSYLFNFPSGASIVLICFFFYAFIFIINKIKLKLI
ncbi:metal ABC transporter permease [Mammaliicoccus stepanovicii]|uniref:Manganese transport system membrane protein MntC n=1 Tax=Mammaliicoccus stepanovicii TaxID=643214 RepID=A0A239YFI1_9STAP|nr:metal ABC transporter permease [Mammaliicoccus stepanovicii]PNZ75839.1 manganese ABC transporter permease [Mammaliicoccus stepanovicii]GGI42729.1 membrane protein [Mammaliicoccus stepanovicii]SNV57176.1 Manganese ABC transporter, inner membrane permease protein SitD [Mammaliicoccus stepanovicii]